MIVDFWRMIWQQSVEKIVMLTNLVESGTVKCLQYWPDELNGVCKYGRIAVKYVDVGEINDYNIRTFIITKGKEARTVLQFHFKTWPDKDVPDTTWCLVDFWRAVDTSDMTNKAPIVVHCSAGIGRTGTFIALDNLISQARIEHCVRPLQIVEALREQRVNMVQTKEQYEYLHEALAETLLMGTHHVLTRQFRSVYNYLIDKDSNLTTTRLEHQFELVKQSVENHHGKLQPVASQEAEYGKFELQPVASKGAEYGNIELQPVDSQGAEYGNIETIMAELKTNRANQERSRNQPVEINALAFNMKKGMLVISKPTKQHLASFWSRLEQLGSITVIDLASDALDKMLDVMLEEEDETRLAKGASVIKKSQHNGFVETTYSLKESTQGSLKKTIKHFAFISWRGTLPADRQSLLEMIDAVHTWQSEMTDDKPIVILDRQERNSAIDSDECSLREDVCVNSRCYNFPGGYRCSCNMGFARYTDEKSGIGH
ncbi:hypothetical protein DPMN_105738 [Dreissena polymorpha]|uniref:protein-tyrosine-phosphatase n=1 Tax=Dreissena polymorpha TaxID=45954 RepID=A0A9D4K3Q3_DREPO|nr:hypothetical protein DPMN_105738 [Dreissena polymorpha]